MSTVRRLDASRIYSARLRANLSLDDVAHGLRDRGFRTTASAVWRWERGKSAPGSEVLASLADVLSSDLDDFYSVGDGEAEDDEASREVRLRRLRADLILAGRDDLAADLAAIAGLTIAPEVQLP